MSTDTDRSVNLGPDDCAIIVRKDGQIESLIPHMEDDKPVPEEVLITVAAAAALCDPEQSEKLRDYFLGLVAQLPQEENSQSD